MSLLEAGAITVERGGRAVVAAVDLTLAAGELVGIVGPNGAGKSTLLRALAGLLRLAEGSLLLDGKDLSLLSRNERARRVGYHPQNPQLHWPLTVGSVVSLGRIPHAGGLARLAPADRRAVADALQLTGLGSFVERRADSLSGGEMARVHLARLFAGQHSMLLADEPIANLDPRYQVDVLDLLLGHARRGGAVAVVLHDLNLAARYCDRLLLLDSGRAHACGPPAAVLTPATMERVFAVPADYLRDHGIDRALAGAAPPAPH